MAYDVGREGPAILLIQAVLSYAERWVPDGLSSEAARRAQVQVAIGIMLGPVGALIGASLASVGALGAGLAIALTGLVCLSQPLVLAWTGRVGLASNLMLLGFVQGLIACAVLLGGAGTPPTAWWVLVPVIATATQGGGAASRWTAVVMLAAVALAGAQTLGLVDDPYLAEPGWLAVGTLTNVFLYLMVGLFLRANERSFQQVLERALRAEAAERRANRAKSTFLATMSHELRTPLNAILGYTELIGEEAVDLGAEALVDDLERVRHSGLHLLGMVNDVLDLSKIEAGRLELRRDPVPLAELAREVGETMAPLVAASGDALEIDVAADLVAVGDRTRVRQCLVNLVGNAAKFCQGGTVSLRGHAEGEWVRLRVRDTGIGMTAEQAERVFDAFAQAEADTSERFGGTGLGLPIALRLAQGMGGDLTVVSAPGEGTTFTLSLVRGVVTP